MNKRHHRRNVIRSHVKKSYLRVRNNFSEIIQWFDSIWVCTPDEKTPCQLGKLLRPMEGELVNEAADHCQHHHWVSLLPPALVPHYLIPHRGLGPLPLMPVWLVSTPMQDSGKSPPPQRGHLCLLFWNGTPPAQPSFIVFHIVNWHHSSSLLRAGRKFAVLFTIHLL